MRIAIIGYGLEGKTVLHYFAKAGHEITVCDLHQKQKEFQESASIHFRFGPSYLQNIENFDLIFRSPGIPYFKKEFDSVRSKLTSLTKYFFQHCPCPIIGVTGTKGKGTTATLIYEMINGDHGRKGKVFLAGNIGHPPLKFLDELNPCDLVILELSSFQLQDLKQSPHIAVVLGITPDHLDYHQNMEEYVRAKENIIRFQNGGDFAVLDFDNEFSRDFEKKTKAKIFHFSLEKRVNAGGFLKVGSFIIKRGKTGTLFGKKGQTKLIGDHNVKNILAAAAAASILNIPVEVISKITQEFTGLPHRLEFITETAGVRYYNDSSSTNPDTTIAALRSFSQPLILIAGGSEKNADFTSLGQEIAQRLNVKSVILTGQTKGKIEQAIETSVAQLEKDIAERILRNTIVRRRNIPLELISSETYQEAFMVAKMLAKPGDIVLLSPACASFDMFSNYQERGDIFRKFVLD